MVVVKPFRAFRPSSSEAKEIAGPPYDVLNSAEARSLLSTLTERSFLRVNKPEVDLPEDLSQYDIQVYEKGAENLKMFIEKGWLKQDEVPCLHIYSQRMGDHEQFGICGGVPVEDYATGKIKRHEVTTVKKENDRTRLSYVQNANVGPVFLTYRDCASVDDLVKRVTSQPPETSFVGPDKVEHKVWPVSDPQMLYEFQKAFKEVPYTYIADGHHRSASAFRVGEMKIKEAIARGETISGAEPFNYFMAVLFPASHLKIQEYNRYVKDLAGFTEAQFLERVAVCFEVTQVGPGLPKLSGPTEVGMRLKGCWYHLKCKEGTFDPKDPVNGLDVQVLYDNLLVPVLNIVNERTDDRISYVGGIRGPGELERLVESGQAAVAFWMYPVTIEQLMAVSDAERLMPPKATWFEPKLSSGLIVRCLDSA